MIIEQLLVEIEKVRAVRGGLAKLVRESGVSGRSLQNLINGKHTPTVDVVEALANAMGMEVMLTTPEHRILYGTGIGMPKSVIYADCLIGDGVYDPPVYGELKPRRREEED